MADAAPQQVRALGWARAALFVAFRALAGALLVLFALALSVAALGAGLLLAALAACACLCVCALLLFAVLVGRTDRLREAGAAAEELADGVVGQGAK